MFTESDGREQPVVSATLRFLLTREYDISWLKEQSPLPGASKKLNGQRGDVDLLIARDDDRSIVFVFEMKAGDANRHESASPADNRDKPEVVQKYAVDGAQHYARFLSEKHNVVSVGVTAPAYSSNRPDDYLVTVDLWKRGETSPFMRHFDGTGLSGILRWAEYKSLFARANVSAKSVSQARRDVKMVAGRISTALDNVGVGADQRAVLVAACLVALENPQFSSEHGSGTNGFSLPAALKKAVADKLSAEGIPEEKRRVMLKEFNVVDSPNLAVSFKGDREHRTVLGWVMNTLSTSILHYREAAPGYDILGTFYEEFFRYTVAANTDITFTPAHVVELFVRLAKPTPSSRVLDLAAGSGGFLVAAMDAMRSRTDDLNELAQIREHGLVGVELNERVFTILAANMIFRGDGKANLYQGDSLSVAIQDKLRADVEANGPYTHVLMNPPYNGRNELLFFEKAMSLAAPGALGICILPRQRLQSGSADKIRATLLKRHELVAVMTMRDDLFKRGSQTVGTKTAIMVFRANVQGGHSGYTWLADWSDDGHDTVHHNGRVDSRWSGTNGVLERWLDGFERRATSLEAQSAQGYRSLATKIDKDSHVGWLFADHDPANSTPPVSKREFEHAFYDYNLFSETVYPTLKALESAQRKDELKRWAQEESVLRRANEIMMARNRDDSLVRQENALDTFSTTAEFRVDELFSLENGTINKLASERVGDVPFIGASAFNNGVTAFVSAHVHLGGCITVATDGSIGASYPQYEPFAATTNVTVLRPLGEWLTPARAVFVCVLIKHEATHAYSYERKLKNGALPSLVIRLPVDSQGKPDWAAVDAFVEAITPHAALLAT